MTGGAAFNAESSRQIPANRPPRSSRRPGSGYSPTRPPGGRGGHSARCWPAPGSPDRSPVPPAFLRRRKRKELFDAHDQVSFSDRAGLGPDTFDHSSAARDARAGKNQELPIPHFMMPPERDAGAGALAGPSPHELSFSHRTGGVLRLRRTSPNGTLPKNSPPRAIWVSIPTEKFSLDKSAKLL